LTKPKAFVVVREAARARVATAEGRAHLREELKQHAKDALSKHKYPRWVVFVDDVPRNDRGKVDRKLLARREAGGESPSE
jgi:acyl-coenzyme A synthetase/AMP-(fatty) acid ligase